jgi:hypothetical protein
VLGTVKDCNFPYVNAHESIYTRLEEKVTSVKRLYEKQAGAISITDGGIM